MSGTHELDEQRKRAARNQSVFREVNERIEEFPPPSSFVEFVCECANPECSEKVGLTLEEYEDVRRAANRFFVLPGHEIATVEEVTFSNDRYAIVSKLGAAAPVAQKLDPRQRQTSA
jgi:hypothetical protein